MGSESTVSFDPWDIEIRTDRGETLLDLANELQIGIEALCGGNGVCGTCMVQVIEGDEHLSPVTEEERSFLGDDQIEKGYRLGCEAEVGQGDVTVFVPSKSRTEGGIIMTEGRSIEFDICPAVRLHHVRFRGPTLEDHLGDRERVLGALEDEYDLSVSTVDRKALCDLPVTMRGDEDEEDSFRCTAAVHDEDELLALYPGRHEDAYGVAVDIGTTTLAVYLTDLRTGETAAVTSKMNPQSKHGGNIISRIEYATRSPSTKEELQTEIVRAVNEMIEEVTEKAGISPSDILDAVFVGNTAMHHLFLGIDAASVAASPYVPANHVAVNYKARELGIDIHESATLTWLPIIGGWVGPDFVANLLAADLFEREETTVYIDIGTNGEIAVSTEDQTWAASAPAGPALEGAEITHGVQAKPGAIEGVKLDQETWEPTIEVIGDGAPIGVCGSGILDVVAQLFLVGAIDRRGRFREPDGSIPRLRDGESGDREFVLVYEEDADVDHDIVISQEDIRDIQNAKAAIQTGTLMLLRKAGVDDVDRLVMAGGFGNSIDPESARILGMYPELSAENVEFLGNAAGFGAMYALMNTEARREAERIVEEVEYVELAALDDFHDEFMKAMYLPHHDFDRHPSVRRHIEGVRGPVEDL